MQHEARLAHGGEELFVDDGGGQAGEAEVGAPRGDRAGGTHDHVMAEAVQVRELAHELDEAWAVQLASAAGEYACSEFDDDALGHEGYYTKFGLPVKVKTAKTQRTQRKSNSKKSKKNGR